MAEPFLPHPDHDQEVAAADPGAGAPDTAPGFGIEGEEPGTHPRPEGTSDADGPGAGEPADDTPFRTPDGTSLSPEDLAGDEG
ncbi:hypothetical protein Cpa01nite_04390 [Cellulomonas pakistanensis]|uniref:Uncharacterized protein n=2 Tax=Cellulomonas pakistanensis TaxID=992287 RepID=A0A919P8H8_9CELL|nr:hypothetical protein Cpa01nite_04390 [Cellulomonas pakistanensis]